MQTIYQTMSDGAAIAVHQWLPKKKPKAVIHIVHGMAEHALRYEDFAEDACTRGFTVFAADHRGHGKTCGNIMLKGYLADKDGFKRVVEDQKEINDEVNKIYQDIPIIILGHSFGSFITQNYIENYGQTVKAAILVGSAGPNSMMNIAGAAAGLNKLFSGRKKPSKFMDKLSFGSYNKTVDKPKTNFDWLSRDEEEVQKYIADEYCGFICTVGFYQDLIKGLKQTHKPSEMAKIPNELPILITSGDKDPVSNLGKSVKKLYDIYKTNGINDLELKLYKDARHEILNETNKEEVKADIFAWIEKRL
ncbi:MULTISPECIES: alpha/beta hydrolase [unclassified Treponema]|uniref:alpha/beta hydrolase n=1 Tax=unclassified Treponema TaxID=2638727 RepID=UPI0020A2C510|nr:MULTISPECIES: alpha/beta hydrolase [unclassified Treponema]UTC67590.1 alpha/beta hydrolase [Treponema sp. OMZ 789]UTC70317.1 alpha/beta hydrolase [Treponema sp. OMZ 790]UTC73032.1 alpha/beta hydrolase [Treponema sp. OMZ 791]